MLLVDVTIATPIRHMLRVAIHSWDSRKKLTSIAISQEECNSVRSHPGISRRRTVYPKATLTRSSSHSADWQGLRHGASAVWTITSSDALADVSGHERS